MVLLYVAFGAVTLWLLGEVLMQRGARPHWRVLALLGFLCVVAGVLAGSMVPIVLGIGLFAVGQTFVTLEVRRGEVDAWGLDLFGRGARRERAGSGAQPRLHVAPVVDEGAGSVDETAALPVVSEADDAAAVAGAGPEGGADGFAEYQAAPVPDGPSYGGAGQEAGGYGYPGEAHLGGGEPQFGGAGQFGDGQTADGYYPAAEQQYAQAASPDPYGDPLQQPYPDYQEYQPYQEHQESYPTSGYGVPHQAGPTPDESYGYGYPGPAQAPPLATGGYGYPGPAEPHPLIPAQDDGTGGGYGYPYTTDQATYTPTPYDPYDTGSQPYPGNRT